MLGGAGSKVAICNRIDDHPNTGAAVNSITELSTSFHSRPAMPTGRRERTLRPRPFDVRSAGAQPRAPAATSAMHAENDVHDALHVTELLRVQVVGHFDVFVVRPGDLEGEARGCELNEPQAEVAGVSIVIVGLDVTDAAIIVLKLTLNNKIGEIGPRQIEIIVAGGLVIERDLEILVT